MAKDIKNRIHKKLLAQSEELLVWYNKKLEKAYLPFYSSFDIRDAGFKMGNVDGNIFPAGFNNICQMDKDQAPELSEKFLKIHYPKARKLLILAEDHFKNTYYWDNVASIYEILSEAGYDVSIGAFFPAIKENLISLESFNGKKISIHKIGSEKGQLMTPLGIPDLVITNNDFSKDYKDMDISSTKMNPAKELGWYRRKKHSYFKHYNQLIHEFANLIEEDPWLFSVPTEKFENFNVTDPSNRQALASQVDQMIEETKKKYEQYSINEPPYVFIKNNSGTYGLGVISAGNGEDVKNLSYKSKKKLKAAKGGGSVSEVVIQEGIPSNLKKDSAIAEPVLYMIGEELAGGFLRTHKKKDSHQSLNSPGAIYKRLCLSDLKVQAQGCLLENVYGWLAKIGLLAITKEAEFIKKKL